jgi:hypothetical protein
MIEVRNACLNFDFQQATQTHEKEFLLILGLIRQHARLFSLQGGLSALWNPHMKVVPIVGWEKPSRLKSRRHCLLNSSKWFGSPVGVALGVKEPKFPIQPF